jgi:hypothetical protein
MVLFGGFGLNVKLIGIIVVVLVAAGIIVTLRPDIPGSILGTTTNKEPKTVPDMYDFSKFTYLDSKLSLGGTIQNVRTEFSETTFKGVAAHRIKITSTINNIKIVEDSYYNSAGIYIGGYLNDNELMASEYAEQYKDHCWIITGKNFSLTKVGSETLTVNDKTYQCTKYTADRNGVLFTFWWTSQAPTPLKVMSQTDNSLMIEEFVGWG